MVIGSARTLLALTGIHPRSEKTTQATQDWERQRINDQTLREQFEEDVGALVLLQESLGFDFISDGLLTTEWQDLLTPVIKGVKGLKKGPLVRWFNTNTFYYVPIVEGPLSVDGEKLAKHVANPSIKSNSKVVLVDPLTFVECSEDRHYGGREKLIFAYCDYVIAPLVRGLEKAGVSFCNSPHPAWSPASGERGGAARSFLRSRKDSGPP